MTQNKAMEYGNLQVLLIFLNSLLNVFILGLIINYRYTRLQEIRERALRAEKDKNHITHLTSVLASAAKATNEQMKYLERRDERDKELVGVLKEISKKL